MKVKDLKAWLDQFPQEVEIAILDGDTGSSYYKEKGLIDLQLVENSSLGQGGFTELPQILAIVFWSDELA